MLATVFVVFRKPTSEASTPFLKLVAEASGGRTCKGIDNKGNPLESIYLSDQNLNIRRGLAQF